ncbi:GGDEF domain-containing protein [Lacticaseibacillus hulanensis]|uniref:GGDEF domain-containing protein n=1 Tax=Lacticaseibacillus hulanensis TaxID=2493111 RepID=UPI0013E2D5FE|nr:GGDEF domain-containing protein [Lacticaseibacillus hulanensis]
MSANKVARSKIDFVIASVVFAILVFQHTEVVTFKGYSLGGISFDWIFLNAQIILAIFMAVTVPSKVGMAFITGTVALFYWERGFFQLWQGWLTFAIVLALALAMNKYSDALMTHFWLTFPFALVICVSIWYTIGLTSQAETPFDWLINLVSFLIQMVLVNSFNIRLRRDYSREMMLTKQATHDGLTTLRNFRAFSADLQAMYAQLEESSAQFVLVTMDVDHFKRINDTYGHLVGNDILKQTAKELRQLMHDQNNGSRAYRTGGEEFSLLIPMADHDDEYIQHLCQQIQATIRQQVKKVDGNSIKWTVSIGCNYVDQDDSGYLEVYRRADKDLYNSKENGRDAITIHGQLLV